MRPLHVGCSGWAYDSWRGVVYPDGLLHLLVQGKSLPDPHQATEGDRSREAASPTADWSFVRFHYGERGRRGNYSDSELETWRRKIAAWRARTEVFAYFNNDWEGFAPRNATALERRSIPAPGDRAKIGVG